MARPIATRFERGDLSGFALVPIPARRRRLEGGGGDHALALAQSLGRMTGRPIIPILHWRIDRGRQAEADLTGRRAGAAGALAADGPAPRRCVLVDDVHTTGSTLAAGSDALKAAGASRVACVTFARTLQIRASAGAW